MSWTRVDLAEPVAPMTPTVAPLGMWRSMSWRFQAPDSGLYLKKTWSKSTDPSRTWRPLSGFWSRMSGSSSSTSMIRLPQATDRVSIIIIMDTIIRLMSTWVM